MGAFRYEAVDAGGRRRRGTVEADTARRARREVASTGLTLLSITEAGEAKAGEGRRQRAARPKEVIATTRQLATLVNASLPVEEALAAVAAQEEGTPAGRTLTAVRTRVVEGWRLSDALGEHPRAFSPLYRGVVAAGEASGTLGPVLLSLATMMERNRAIASKAIMALVYPAVIALVAVVIVACLMVFVVPSLAETYSDMGVTLPALTRTVIAVSGFVGSVWGLVLLLAVLAAVAGFFLVRRRPGPRRRIDAAMLRLPLFGRLSRDLDAARFSRTLSTLFGSGTPLLDAISGARRTVVNTHIDARLDETLTAVREGASLAGGLRRAEVFPPMLASMVAAGERSGTLPEMLDRTADQMEAGFEAATTVALRLLEPAVIVTLGVVVLVIVLAIMLPIVNLTTMPL